MEKKFVRTDEGTAINLDHVVKVEYDKKGVVLTLVNGSKEEAVGSFATEVATALKESLLK